MPTTTDLSTLSGPRKLLLGAALVLLIDSFLPWYHISIQALGVHVSSNASGWHEIGTFVWLLTIALLVIEGCRIAGVLPLDDARAELLSLALAAAVVLFGLIYVIQRLADGSLGFGFYIGVLALIALAVAAMSLFRSGDAATTLRGMQGSTGSDGPGATAG